MWEVFPFQYTPILIHLILSKKLSLLTKATMESMEVWPCKNRNQSHCLPKRRPLWFVVLFGSCFSGQIFPNVQSICTPTAQERYWCWSMLIQGFHSIAHQLTDDVSLFLPTDEASLPEGCRRRMTNDPTWYSKTVDSDQGPNRHAVFWFPVAIPPQEWNSLRWSKKWRNERKNTRMSRRREPGGGKCLSSSSSSLSLSCFSRVSNGADLRLYSTRIFYKTWGTWGVDPSKVIRLTLDLALMSLLSCWQSSEIQRQ